MKMPLLLIGAAFLVACTSTSNDYFLTLSSTVGPVTAPPATRYYTTLAVDLPTLLDRPQVVVQSAQNEVQILDHFRWASPLDEQIRLAIANDLEARDPMLRILPVRSRTNTSPVIQVSIGVDEIVIRPGSELRLVAHWSIHTEGGVEPTVQIVRLAAPLPSTDIRTAPRVLSELVEQLAGQLSETLRSTRTVASPR